MPRCQFYLLTPPAIELPAFSETLKAALDAGDVAALQLRLKPADDGTILRAVDALRPIAQDRGIAFILNDRPDLAAKSGCDGAHIGVEDMDLRAAQKLMGPDAIIGVTCKTSRHRAMEAGEQGASYVAFGAFFDSATRGVQAEADTEILEWWSQLMEVPCVAIGGITPDNCGPLVRAGADFICASAAVWQHPDGPAGGIQAFNRAIAAAG
ncbi:MAG TPA: thiamine phosphate synthase [Alphaproteobacteria bacterium]|nr:thiamine phosphate synthase [Alphaproteobacteria bacterium]